MKLTAALFASALAPFACATGATLKAELGTIESSLDAAREAGAYTCAPRELAVAETQTEFLSIELEQGNSIRAATHRSLAKKALDVVLAKARACKPAPVAVAVVKPKDRDGDGLSDEHDACPDTPGPKELLGCPDRDGDQIIDDEDRCPDEPGPRRNQGCPDPKDRDKDGVLDDDDRCPDEPGPPKNSGCPYGDKDKDTVLDDVDQCPDDPGPPKNKGCPIGDKDGDSFADDVDKCPELPETTNGFQDDDGCPDINPSLVSVNRELGKIEIKQKVYFDTNKATIQSRSFKLLNEVAEALKANPTMEVLVEGHTDDKGSDTHNLKLSQARADSVREYVVGQGVELERLKAMGFGETKPVVSNKTGAGREKNRRVEFTIVKE